MAKEYGGAGGQGSCRAQGVSASAGKAITVGGGAGNPGANGTYFQSAWTTGDSSTYKGSNGTGGLLIIYADSIINTGKISSNGSQGGSGTIGGGGSGGGSVNIFYKNTHTNSGSEVATGGTSGQGTEKNGGAGGDGTVTVTKIIL